MRNRISIAIFLILLWGPSWAQIGGDYNPTNPSDPGTPVQKYTLKLKSVPTDGGSFNTSETKVSVGEKYNLRAYPNTDFTFVAWLCEGDTLSKSASYDYVMPAHNVEITGVFTYSPSSPSDPQEPVLKYQLSLVAKPMNSGSFNLSNERLAVGSANSLYAYTNTDFVFKHWMIGDSILSTNQRLDFVMPTHDVQIVGQFEYNPANPANPNRNHWNKELGEVIVDDFTPGSLSNAISTVISGSNSSDVAMITVAGKMNDNDFGIANNYTNCTLLDLSRVTGVTQIPSYAFDYTNLESVYLPATIEKIGYRAFYDCKQLQALTVYAMTPPELDSYVFTGVQEGLIVYVPAAAIAHYQDANGWKNFTLLPIQEDIRSISVSLPEGTNTADYAQMWLELTNTKSGQKIHYVMTDRTSYTFANIIRNTSWNVVLRNQNGAVFGLINNIDVKDEDVSVTFTSLAKPQNVSLVVITPDGQDVTAQTQVTWTDEAGNYLAQAYGLNGLLPETKIGYRVALSQDLAMQYATPTLTTYTVSANGNDVKCQLAAIQQVLLTGKVKDLATKTALSGAVVSASQTFGGKYSKTISTRTDASGNYTLTISNVPTSLAIAATDYISQAIVCDSLLTDAETVTVPEVSLKSITGAVISLGFTYTSSVETGEEAGAQSWYSDYNNVAYTIYNRTKQQSITQFNVQYPQIVLLEEVAEGDVLELTATSKTSAFMPVKAIAAIDAEQRANAAFDIVELGKIQASFAKNGNATVVGSLYNANGKLLKSYDYNNASLTISNLVDGNYILVSMGSSKLFNTIYDLKQLPQTGLVLDSDYVQNAVEVKSGVVSVVSIKEVPILDESKLYYTGDNTSFTVNKSSIVAGNYLTLTGHLDFKSAYATSVSNVNLIVDLPESCSFVENSVMVGNNTSNYTLSGTRLTIPMARYTDRVRFCVIPTLGGEYAPSAFAQFDLNGETVTQPIGSANYTAKDLSITVPSVVAKTTIPISGTAIGASAVDIYDNGILIGQTTSLANGTWVTTCELNKPYNLSRHQIYAKVTTKQGIELVSENVSCVYDVNAIQVSVVKMYHDNPEMHKTYELTFDFLNPSNKEENYIYYIYNKKFTFTIDFTNNDTTKVSNVVLYVRTAKSGWHPLEATYDAKQDKWIAAGEFGNMYDGDLPVNVSVEFDTNTTAFFDDSELEDVKDNGLFLLQDFVNTAFEVDSLYSDAINKLSLDNYEEVIKSSINDILSYSGTSLNEIGAVPVDLDTEVFVNESEIDLENMDKNYNDFLSSININSLITQFEDAGFSLNVQSCEGLTEDSLTGYEKVVSINGDFIYYQSSETYFSIICPRMNLFMTLRESVENQSRPRRVYSAEEAKTLSEWASKIADVAQVLEKMNPLEDVIKDATLKYNSAKNKLAQTQFMLNNSERKLSEAMRKKLLAQSAEYSKQLAKAQRYLRWLNGLKRALPIVNVIKLINDLSNNVKELHSLYISVPDPCEGDQAAADKLHKDIFATGVAAGIYGVGQATLCAHEIGMLIPSIAAAYSTGGTSLLAELALIGAQVAAGWVYDSEMERRFTEYRQRLRQLKCKVPPPSGDDGGNGGHPSNNPDKKFGIDPSGYVYEGVSTNRVEGVTATIYYKEDVEDMYGDFYENIVKWNAEEYAQENPLFTDENGYYRWDVPQGLWQVKFEKEGYETTYSEWLPVPPPQLEVNIAMKQNVQPNVQSARAYEDAVEVEFDKYMMPELLNTENITVMADGKNVEGMIELLNEEVSYEGETETFASKVRFNAVKPFDATEVTLTVSNRVKSYAGIRMQDDFSQTFTIEQEVRKIVCDSVAVVGYGEIGTLAVTVLPASASAGKTLNVRTSSSMILSTDIESIVLNEEGKAEIPVTGELPGTAAITFTIDGYDLSGTTIVNVQQIETVVKPTANIASGTTVGKGTKIILSCTTEGATIYYTLDGSCPCDNTSARIVYDGTPIVINENTTIKAMAVAPNMYESEVVEFTYIVDGTDIHDVTISDLIEIYPLPVREKLNVTAGGKTIKSVIISSLDGILVASANKATTKVTLDVSKMPTGIYIIKVVTEKGVFSRKILKVQ